MNRKNQHLIFRTFVILVSCGSFNLIPTYAVEPADRSRDDISVAQLLERWKAWRDGFKTLPPLHRDALTKELFDPADTQLSVTRHDDYIDRPAGYAVYHRVVEKWDSVVLQPEPNDTVGLYRPGRFISLTRESDAAKWKIAHSSEGIPMGDLCPISFKMIDDLLPAMEAQTQDWGSPTVERGDDTIELAFRFRPPFISDPGPSSYEVTTLELSFRTDLEYTPSRLRESLKVRTGDEWQIETRLGDFVQFGGIQYPRNVEGYDPAVVPMKLGYTEVTSLIDEVPKQEVARRTDLAFWKLANMNVGKSYLRWWVIGGLACLSVAAWWWRSSRTT